MKHILLILTLGVTGLKAQCYKVDTVVNASSVVQIAERAVEFGAKATLEELISEKYSLCDTGKIVSGKIVSIAMPEQLINIVGMQFLKRQYIVNTEVNFDGKTLTGTATKTIYVNAMFLEVEKIPHNKKTYYKTMQESLKKALNYN